MRPFASAALGLALAARAGAMLRAADPDLVFMQQMVVEASHADWKYLSCAGYEVLSRCDEADTRWFSTGFFHSMLLQDQLLPENFLPAQEVPLTAILYDRNPAAVESLGNLVPAPVQVKSDQNSNYGGLAHPKDLSLPAMAHDDDTVALATNLWGAAAKIDRHSTLIFADGGLFNLRLERRHPIPPLWLRVGLIEPFGLARVVPTEGALLIATSRWVTSAQADADLRASNRQAMARARESNRSAPADIATLPPFVTTSQTKIVLLPLEEIFRERRDGEGQPSDLWRAEAALFVRWGYFGAMADPALHLKFLRFLTWAETEPLTEAVFKRCFGFGYAAMESQLAEYHDVAVAQVIRAPYRQILAWPPPLPRLVRRTATEAEVARIVGDWERMTGVQFRSMRPDLAKLYLQHAGETLRRPYLTGSRDPRLLAALGLYDHDVGDDVAARALLETAVKAKVLRPAAYRALAQLRFEEACEHGKGPTGQLEAAQVETVLEPLLEGSDRNEWPLANYRLYAEVLARSDAAPSAENWAVLADGLRCFPRALGLVRAAVQICQKWGERRKLADFLTDGVRFADNDAALAEFDAQLTALQKSSP